MSAEGIPCNRRGFCKRKEKYPSSRIKPERDELQRCDFGSRERRKAHKRKEQRLGGSRVRGKAKRKGLENRWIIRERFREYSK